MPGHNKKHHKYMMKSITDKLNVISALRAQVKELYVSNSLSKRLNILFFKTDFSGVPGILVLYNTLLLRSFFNKAFSL